MDVIPGSRIAGRLGNTVAVTSRPMVVSARPGETRQAVQSFIREAPRQIERTASADSKRLAPVLAREPTLSSDTVEAMRGRAVVAERGRLAGPGVADIAPRGTRVDRTRTLEMQRGQAGPSETSTYGSDRSSARPTRQAPASGGATNNELGRSAPNRIEPRTVIRGDQNGVEARTTDRDTAREQWRATPRTREAQAPAPRESGSDRGTATFDRSREAAPSSRERPSASTQGDWRSQPRSVAPRDSQPQMMQRSTEDWRTRSTVPPARRVIEGSVPGRQVPDSGQMRSDPRSSSSFGGRDYRSAPTRDMAPPSRSESRPQAPSSAPRGEVRSSAPPPSRMGSPPQSAPRSAPAPQAAPRSAPAPHRQRS